MSAYNNQAAEAHRQDASASARRSSYGSSTGVPGFPTGSQDTRSQYNPATSGYNPSTGAGYEKPTTGGAYPSNSYNQNLQSTPGNAQSTNIGNQATLDSKGSDRFAQKGEDVGRKAQGVMASVHVSSLRLYISGLLGPWDSIRHILTLYREPENRYVEL